MGTVITMTDNVTIVETGELTTCFSGLCESAAVQIATLQGEIEKLKAFYRSLMAEAEGSLDYHSAVIEGRVKVTASPKINHYAAKMIKRYARDLGLQ